MDESTPEQELDELVSMSQADYADDPRCPHCKSRRILNILLDVEAPRPKGRLAHGKTCLACKAQWHEIYDMQLDVDGYYGLTVPR